MKKKNLAMYGISRIDDDIYRTHAWRVSLRRHGKSLVRNFADKKCGGKRKALAEAKRYRDELLHENPPMSRKEFASIMRRNNNTGITGVYRYAKKYLLKDGRERASWYWEAHWPTAPGESQSINFSVNEYGEAVAKQMAIRAREEGLKKLEGVFWASERGSLENPDKSKGSPAKKKASAKKGPAKRPTKTKAATQKATAAAKAAPKKAAATRKTRVARKSAAQATSPVKKTAATPKTKTAKQAASARKTPAKKAASASKPVAKKKAVTKKAATPKKAPTAKKRPATKKSTTAKSKAATKKAPAGKRKTKKA